MPLSIHIVATAITITGFFQVKTILDAGYAASKHPVDYATGQTAFSGPTIKGDYAHMLEAGTLDVYRTTQFIDFGFIVALACVGMFLCTLISRICRPGSWGKKIGLSAGFIICSRAACDAIENGWPFIMLNNPTGLADWLAIPYSSFAVAKFGLITAGMLLTLLCILLSGAGRLMQKPRLG